MKIKFTTIFTCFLFQLSAQFTNINISTGVIKSDLHLSTFEKISEETNDVDVNTSKVNYYLSINSNYKIRHWFYLNGGITYQERLPLEFFRFAPTNEFNPWELAAYPTSSQSNIWNSSRYKRLTNFKYIHFEFIPMLRLKKKIEVSVGIGLFYGHLINHKILKFGRADFPHVDFLFDPPFNVGGQVEYHKDDLGWMPKLTVQYPISERLNIGLDFKGYVSQYRLMKYEPFSLKKYGRSDNNTWMVWAMGVMLGYKI